MTNRSEYLKTYRKRFPEKQRAANKRYRLKHYEHTMWNAAKSRARNKSIEFSILESDIVIPNFCPILGLKLEIADYRNEDNSPSLDRINPKLGYIKSNIQVISHKANRMKNDATFKELELLYLYWREQENGI